MPSRRRSVVRAALDDLEREIQRGDRSNAPVSLVMLDIDDFQIYFRNNGEESGKKLVSSIFRLVHGCSRQTDIITRFSREDLTLILPQTAKAEAGLVAERLLEAVRSKKFPGEDMQPGSKLGVSIGVATYPGDADSSSDLINSADRAMYLAKSSGKNRVQLYDDNRRSLRREIVALDGAFSTFGIESHPLRTVDLSTTGVRFSTNLSLPVGTLLDLQLKLPDTHRSVEMAVRVLRLVEIRAPSFGWISGKAIALGGGYEVAARTVEVARQDLRVLAKYLLSLKSSD